MCPRLRPTLRSQEVVDDWSPTASPLHRDRMRELLLSLEDGTWCTRWWTQQHRSDPEVWEIRFDTNAHLFFRVVDDETDGVADAEFISIEHSQPRDTEGERYPALGEG